MAPDRRGWLLALAVGAANLNLAADNQTAGVIAGYLDGVAAVASRRLGVDPPNDVLRTRFLFNNEFNSRWFVVVMGVLSILMTALTVAREWETGSMEPLLSTPVRPLEMIVGKLAPPRRRHRPLGGRALKPPRRVRIPT